MPPAWMWPRAQTMVASSVMVMVLEVVVAAAVLETRGTPGHVSSGGWMSCKEVCTLYGFHDVASIFADEAVEILEF